MCVDPTSDDVEHLQSPVDQITEAKLMKQQDSALRVLYHPGKQFTTKSACKIMCKEYLQGKEDFAGKDLEKESEERWERTYVAGILFCQANVDFETSLRWSHLSKLARKRLAVLFEEKLKTFRQPVLPLQYSADYWATNALLAEVIRNNGTRSNNNNGDHNTTQVFCFTYSRKFKSFVSNQITVFVLE